MGTNNSLTMQWRGGPAAIHMRMFANRLSDPAVSKVLDEHDNMEQHLGLTLSMKGYVGSNYRDQIEKEGGEKSSPLSLRRLCTKLWVCLPPGPFPHSS